MSKKSKRRSNSPAIVKNVIEAQIVENADDKVTNGFMEAMGIGGGGTNSGFPSNQGAPWSAQLSQPNTLWKNLRWFLVSNDRQLLSEAYVEIGLLAKIVDMPVDDALRGGIEIQSKDLDDDQIEELLISLDRDNDLNTVGQGEKWNRLFGGGGILTLTDQDPEEELDIASVGPDTPLEFRAVDLWEMTWDKQNAEGYDPTTQTEQFEYYTYYGEPVHKSRFMRLKGNTAPSFIRPRLRGWGLSIIETLIRPINQYLKATDLSFEVLDEFKVDIYKIKGLTNSLMSPIGEEKVKRRMQMANYQKNYNNALVMDSEDDWDHKQLSMTGLSDTMEGIRVQLASEMNLPMIKLFGTPAQGLNASDESSIEVYNSMVESQIRNKIKYPILRICEIKCQKLFGFIPDDLAISFKPLKVLSAVEEEQIKKEKFNRLIQLRESGDISSEEFRDAVNRGKLVDITLSDDKDLTGYRDDTIVEGNNNPKKPKCGDDDPGADRVDTARSKATDVVGAPKDLKKPTAPNKSHQDTILKARMRNENIQVFGRWDLMRRGLNSVQFDRKSYEADGGDSWVDPRRKAFYEDPQGVDEAQWQHAKMRSKDVFGKENWAFALWFYKKMGGSITKR